MLDLVNMASVINDSIIGKLKDLIYNQNQNVTVHFVSKYFQVHTTDAIKILEHFADKYKNDTSLRVNYSVFQSSNSNDDPVKLQRFMIVEDLDMIDEGNSHHVYSIGRSTNVELNFEHYLLEPKSENFDQLQKLTYIQNKNIQLRPIRRSSTSSELKFDSLVKEEPANNGVDKSEKMDVVDSKDTALSEINEKEKDHTPADKIMAPKRTLKTNSKETKPQKQYKRVKVCDSDSEDEENKMETDNGFKVTNLEETKPAPVKTEPEPVAKPVKKDPPAANKGKFSKPKAKTQASITSFFKKK